MVTILGNKIIIDSSRATLDDKSAFEQAVNTVIEGGASEVLVDFSKTVYLPSELLGYLMGKKRALMGKGMDIKIIAISEPLKRVFDEARISGFLGV
ncbi:MAG: hypothetical protein EHM32_09710 [Spirochaetales bacterium]|nr:MAG: hypothetical protein EHM32_09710 [Spirochaetales bacterium]